LKNGEFIREKKGENGSNPGREATETARYQGNCYNGAGRPKNCRKMQKKVVGNKKGSDPRTSKGWEIRK
jgi:hypothetical protein